MSDMQMPGLAPVPRFTKDEQMAALAEVFGEKYAEGFRDPVVFMDCTFMSPTVKQFYVREFPLISRTLFVELVYRRRPDYNHALLDDFAAMSARRLSDILKLLSTQCDRLRAICASNGVPTDATYMHPERHVVPIIAGHAKTFIATLQRLDEAYQLAGSANLNGVIDGSTRMKMELLCRRAVRAFSAMLRHEIVKLRKESDRMHQAALGIRDQELETAEAAQGAAIEAFDQQVAAAATIDGHAHVAPEAAAETIDELAAATEASAAARGGRRKKEAASEPAVSTETQAAPAEAAG